MSSHDNTQLNTSWLEIDLGALVRNARALRDLSGVPIIPMVKADAYGLGAVEVTRALEELDPMAYGVATVKEGVELREAGVSRAIVVFSPILPEHTADARENDLTPSLSSAGEIDAWGKSGRPYHLSIDTGMARAGIPWRLIDPVLPSISRYPPAAAFTHFHSAQMNDGTIKIQESRFRDAIASLPVRPPLLHAENSAAIVRAERSLFNAVRPGIFMYGVGSGDGARLEPECVVRMKARIIEIRTIEPGDTVSYDATYTAESQRQIATLAAGYADGYPRGASGFGVALLRGTAVPIAGRVTMDMIMLDVTEVAAEVGDVVTLIGESSSSAVPIDIASLAELAQMSPYELLTGLRCRISRVYSGATE